MILKSAVSNLMLRGIPRGPLIARICRLLVVAMVLSLSLHRVRAKRLSRELRARQERMRLACRVSNTNPWEGGVGGDSIWFNEADSGQRKDARP